MATLNDRMTGTKSQSDPAVGAVALTLADVTLGTTCRAIHCNTAGTLSVIMQDGSAATFTMSAGVTYPYAIRATVAAGSATFAGYGLL